MPPIQQKRKCLRRIGSHGGRSKKVCQQSPTAGSNSSQDEFVLNEESDEEAANRVHGSLGGSQDIGTGGSGSGQGGKKGPAKSTLWRRAQKEKEKQRLQEASVDERLENSWEDLETQVEEKWPMVGKEVRLIVLKKGMLILL